jgi:hypothetical protein
VQISAVEKQVKRRVMDHAGLSEQSWIGSAIFLIVFLNLVRVLSFIKKKRAKQLHLRGYKRLKAETNPAAKETTTQTPQQVARLFQQVLGELG